MVIILYQTRLLNIADQELLILGPGRAFQLDSDLILLYCSCVESAISVYASFELLTYFLFILRRCSPKNRFLTGPGSSSGQDFRILDSDPLLLHRNEYFPKLGFPFRRKVAIT